jgi:hypothetical protein
MEETDLLTRLIAGSMLIDLLRKDESMKTVKLTVTLLVGAMFMLTAATLTASDPVGIYAIVEKVIFEPSEAAPQRVQIWGAFAFADTTRGGDYYTKPQVGYLYYSLPAGNEAITRKEWADLKSVAGTGQGVAFGRRYSAHGRVRPESEKPASPESYLQDSTSFGVTKVNPISGYQGNMTDIVTQLKAALKKS